jgi:hypothetical protein
VNKRRDRGRGGGEEERRGRGDRKWWFLINGNSIRRARARQEREQIHNRITIELRALWSNLIGWEEKWEWQRGGGSERAECQDHVKVDDVNRQTDGRRLPFAFA